MLNADVERMSRTETGRLGELYVRHADAAVRLAYLLTGDMALAEDLVQDAFVRLAGRLVHLREPGAFDAYLRRTVVNLANSHFRRRKVERAYLQRAKGSVEVHAAASGGERTIEDRDEVWTALRRVSARQRAALVLRFYEDLSEADTAAALGCSVGTVKSQTAKALARLRSLLATDTERRTGA
jgi:RNA polymerase sigma-70 factor (sigma-E family)